MPDLWPWGIAAACFSVAVAAILKTVEAQSLLSEEKKKTARLEIENAALQAKVDQSNKSAADDKPQPIKYPKSSRVT